MANTKKDFSNRKFLCKKCGIHLADDRLDRQLLVFDNVGVFNFCSLVCLACQSTNVWQSPNLLRDKNEKSLCRIFDKASDLPKPDKRIVNQLGKGVSKGTSGKYRARIVTGGQTHYLGHFDSIAKASQAYQKAKLFAENQKQFAQNLNNQDFQSEINHD